MPSILVSPLVSSLQFAKNTPHKHTTRGHHFGISTYFVALVPQMGTNRVRHVKAATVHPAKENTA